MSRKNRRCLLVPLGDMRSSPMVPCKIKNRVPSLNIIFFGLDLISVYPENKFVLATTVPPQTVQDDQNATQVHAIQFCKKFLQARIELTEDTAMVPRNGIFLEYQAMAKQDGQKNGVSGIPILGIPDFTRLIREMFPTSQLINDAQSRQVFSGIKIKPKETVVTNGPVVKPKQPNGNMANGNGISSKECSPQKINGKANGVRNGKSMKLPNRFHKNSLFFRIKRNFK